MLTAKEKDKIERIRRRIKFLEDRLKTRDEINRHHDASELSALRWAVVILANMD